MIQSTCQSKRRSIHIHLKNGCRLSQATLLESHRGWVLWMIQSVSNVHGLLASPRGVIYKWKWHWLIDMDQVGLAVISWMVKRYVVDKVCKKCQTRMWLTIFFIEDKYTAHKSTSPKTYFINGHWCRASPLSQWQAMPMLVQHPGWSRMWLLMVKRYVVDVANDNLHRR